MYNNFSCVECTDENSIKKREKNSRNNYSRHVPTKRIESNLKDAR
jgi:hypothetical protein